MKSPIRLTILNYTHLSSPPDTGPLLPTRLLLSLITGVFTLLLLMASSFVTLKPFLFAQITLLAFLATVQFYEIHAAVKSISRHRPALEVCVELLTCTLMNIVTLTLILCTFGETRE